MSWESRADRINRDLPVYVWSQIADDLRADIESGELTPGQRLPSGPELAEIYGVTKVTATKAIRHLQEADLLTVVNGMGTYVTAD